MLKVVIGDQMGMVRVLDLTQIISTLKIKPLKQPINQDKRNPYRIIDLDGSDNERDAYDGMSELQALEENITPPMLQDLFVQQQAFWKGHNDAIKNIDFILETDKPFIFTTGLDRMAKIWNLKGEIQGIFAQGIMTKVQKPWTFPLQRYNSQFMKRKIAIKSVLQTVQKKRALEQEKQKLLGREQQKRQTKMSFGAAEDAQQDFNVMEIDDQIGEVLRNEEVFKDLKELEDILQKNPIFDQDQDMHSSLSPQTASSGNRY